MGKFTVFILLLLFYFSATAQKGLSFATVGNTKRIKTDTSQVIAMMEQAKTLWYDNPDTALTLARQSEVLARQINYSKGIAQSLHIIGKIYQIKGDYFHAIDYCLQSLQVAMKLGEKKLIADNFNNIGASHYLQNNYTKALDYYFQALRQREQLHAWADVAASFDNIGLVYTEQANYVQALTYYHKSLEIETRLQNKQDIAITLTNIGIVYQKQGEYDKALKNFLGVKKTFEEVKDKYGIRIALQSIASIYQKKKQYVLALEYGAQAVALAQEMRDEEGIASSQLVMSEIYYDQNNCKASEQFALQSLATAQKIGAKGLVEQTSNMLADNYKNQKQYDKALDYYQLAQAAHDSIFSIEKAKAITNLQANYELEKKELQIKALSQERIAQEQKLVNHTIQRNALIAGFLLLFGLAFMIVRYAKQQQKMTEIRTQQTLADIIHLSSHKIRGPIASILGLAMLYNKTDPTDSFNQQVIDNIEISAKKLDVIVHEAVFRAHDEVK